MANLFQAWDEDIQALGAAKASDDQIEARRQQLAEHFKAKAKAAGLSSKKIYETLDQFDAYSRQNTTAQDDQLTPEEQEMAQRVKDGTVGAGAMKEVGKRFKDVGLGVVSSLTRMGGDVAQTWADVGDNDKSELSSQVAQGLYNATDDIRSNYSEGTKQAKKDFWSPAGLTMGVSENLGQIAGTAALLGTGGAAAGALGVASKAGKLATMAGMAAPLAYSQGYGQGKESSLDEINKTSNAQLWENVKAEAKAYDDAGGTGEVPYLVGMFKEAGGDLNLMKDLMAENAGNVTGLMTVATEPLAMGVGSVMSRGAAAGGKGLRAGLVNAMNNQGMSNELARRIAAGGSAGIASQVAKIGLVQGMRGTGQEGIQEGGEGYIAKTEGSLAAGRKGELTGKDWRGEHGIIQQGLQGAAIGGIMAGGSVYSSARNASKLALEKNGLPEKHDAAIIAKEQADAALAKAANIADANPNDVNAQNAYAEAQDAALVATNDLEQLTGKFNALYTPEEQAVIKAATMEGVAARKKVADDAAKAQKELDDAQAKVVKEQEAQQAEIAKAQRENTVNKLASMVGDEAALNEELARLNLGLDEENALLVDAHKIAKKQKKAQQTQASSTATPKTPIESAVDMLFDANGKRNTTGAQDAADKHKVALPDLIIATSERIASNEEKAKQNSKKETIAKEQALNQKQKVADAKKSDLADKQQLENTLSDFAANNDHDSMVNFLRDYEPTEADKLIKNAYASVENKKKAEQDAIAATKKAEALKVKESEAKTQAEQKKIAFNQDMADLHTTNPDATMADLNVIGKKHGVKSPIELAKAWVKAKNEAKAAKEAAPVDQQADAAEVTDEERLNAKKALYSLYKNKGYPDDVVASHVMGEQERANKDGAPRNIWESVSGAIGSSPASQKSPFKDGKLITTIHPEGKAAADEQAVDNAPTKPVEDDNIENQDTKPIIVRNDGKPFPTQAQAEKALEVKSKKPRKKKEQSVSVETHKVIPVDGGFAIAPVVEVDDKKREAQIRSEINAAVEFYPDVLHKYAVENGLRESNDYSIMTSDMKKQIIDAVVKKELSKQNKKPDDNEDGGVIADSPKPNAPVSPSGGTIPRAHLDGISGKLKDGKTVEEIATRIQKRLPHLTIEDVTQQVLAEQAKASKPATLDSVIGKYSDDEEVDAEIRQSGEVLKQFLPETIDDWKIDKSTFAVRGAWSVSYTKPYIVTDRKTGKEVVSTTTSSAPLDSEILLSGDEQAIKDHIKERLTKNGITPRGVKNWQLDDAVSPTGQQAVDNTPTQAIEDDGIKTKHIKQPKKANRTINEDKDDLLAAIAKLDGLNLADAKSQGIDVEAYKGKRAAGLLGIFKQDGTGSDFDTMAEYLSGYGYPVHEGGNTAWDNVTGSYSVNALADALITALNGGDVGTTSYMQNKLQAQMEADQKEAEEMERLFNGKGSSTWDEAEALDTISDVTLDEFIKDESAIPENITLQALKEAENEQQINVSNSRQTPNAKTEASSIKNDDAKAIGNGKTGQQESQSSTGQDSGIGLNPSFNLNAQTNEELAKRDAENKAAEAKRQAEEKAAKDKAQADKEVSDFRLSGSNAPADIAMAGGQKDMFAPPTRGEREAEKAKQEPTKEEPVKWFGTQAKADEWVAKQKGKTFDIRQSNGRFEIYPAKEQPQGNVIAKKGIVVSNAYGSDGWRIISDVKDTDEMVTVIENENMLSERKLTMNMESFKERLKQDAEGRKQYQQAQDKSVQNNAPAPTKQPETKKDPKGKVDFSEAIKTFEEVADRWQGIKKGDVVITKGGQRLIAQTDVGNRLSIRFKRADGSFDALTVGYVTGDRSVSVLLSKRFQEKQKQEQKQESTKKLIGKNSEGNDLYEDGNGIRFVDNGNGFLVGESVAIKLGNVANPYDTSNRTDEHRTVEEVAARQPKPKKLQYGDEGYTSDMANQDLSELYLQKEKNGMVEDDRLNQRIKNLEKIFYELRANEPLGRKTSEEKPTPSKEPSKNTIFTEDAAEKARAILRKKLGGNQLNSGIDPEILQAGLTLAGYHIESGARSFAAFAKAIVDDMGDMVKPYLKSWYMGVKYDPRAANFDGMSSAAEVDSADIESILKVDSQQPATPTPTANGEIVDDYDENDLDAGDGTEGWKYGGYIFGDDDVSYGVGYREIRKVDSNGTQRVIRQIRIYNDNRASYMAVWENESSKITDGILDGFSIDTAKFHFSMSDATENAFSNDATDGDALWTRFGREITDSIKYEMSREPKPNKAPKDKIGLPSPKQPTDKGDSNESQGNGSNSTRPLENVLPEGNQPTGEEGNAGQRGNRGGKTNTNGNGRANAGRSNRGGGVAAGQNAMDFERPSQELAEQELAEEAEKVEDKTLPGQPRTPKKLTGVNPGNYRITEADKIGTGTPGERLKQNLEAIRLVRTLQAEGRYATKEEQAVLAKYVGWGGLANAFDEASKQKQYREANAELKRLLSPEEYTEALLSTRNAHYTSPKVIKAMYDLVRHLGFMGGNVLEPTVGSGNFIGLMPEDFAASSNWYAAEIDPITGALAQYLYPEGQVMAGTGFQDAEFAYGKFDLAIGNPPFGDTRITDRNKARQHLTRMKIHNYIISKSGMHLRPGGVMAMVITHRFLDTKNDEARAELAKNFRFVGAIRLPNTAFKENANTEVTTDIVVFQKLKPGEEATTNLEWLDTSATIKSDKGQDIRLNGYFAKHPEMMLGKPTLDGTMYAGARGDEFTLEAIPDMDLEQAIADRIKTNLADQAGTMDNSAEYLEAASAGNMVNRADVGIGGFLFEGGKLSMREADDANGNPVFVVLTPQTKWTEKTELGQKRYDRIVGMLHLRQQTIEMIALEMADAPVKLLDKHRALLNKSYDAFVKEHGFLADPANSKLMDGDIGLEFGLENSYQKALSVARAKATGMKPKPASAKKADILSRRVFTPHKVVTSADTAKDGYLVSLSEHGKLDLPYISELTGKTIKQVTDELSSGENPLIFMNPKTEQWEQHDEYLSGNVKAKHQEAVQAGLEVNAKALEAVFPEDVKPNDLHITVRSSWLPIDHFVQFLDLIGVKNSKVSVNPYTGTMYVSFGEDVPNALSDEFKNDDYTISEMLGNLANGKVLTAYDREPDGNGGYKRVVNKDRTAILSIQSKKMKELFNDWMRLDDNRMQEAAKAFNEKMNTHSAREYNGAKMLVTVGASPSIKLLNTQKNAAWRMIQSPVILLDHVVGAGKTFTLITGIMERRRLGLSRKPAMVVPNHLVGQWAKDFYALYPAAKLLAISEKDFAKSNRQRLFARMATGNFDAIIMGHSSLKFIQVSAETESKMVREEIEYLQKALAVASESEDKRTVKTLANQISKKMERFKALGDIKRDTLVEWEQMGIDYLGIDESHEFKNLEYSTSMQRVTGMNDPKGSQRAFDLYTKIRELRARGGGVAFATGTPISNSLVEMYTILRYLNRDELKARGNDVFDAWVGTYGEVDTRIEYTATQKLKSRNVLARFGNLPELLQLYNEVADTVTMTNLKQIYAEQVREANKRTGETKSEKMPIPPVKDGGRQLDVGDLTAAQNEYMDYLVARAESIEEQGGKNDPKIDNLLWISNDARKMSLDMRLVDPMAQDSPDSKVNRAANNIKRTYDRTNANKGTQLVFCDLSTPKKGADKEGKKIIKAALEKLGLDNDNRFARMMEDEPLQIQWRMIMDRADNIIEDESTEDATRERIEDWLDKLDSDIEGILLTADSGFSVYDALKQTLVDQGIPENEIAFIHDYNSKEQKSELFGLVNDGSIRVLLGSSPKMGAGTNVQKRLVALHHMDAPWRPSDVEQREGRIIRQGNLFATPPSAENPNPLYDPNFEVEIKAYSTNRTFDTVMWQTLQRKAAMIEQFRSGEREMVEPNGDAAGYAEFMAQSTGNPAFKRKIEIEGELNGLQAQKRSYMAKQGEARRFLENYEAIKSRVLKSLEGFKDGQIDSATYNGKTYANDYETARLAEESVYKAEFDQWYLDDGKYGQDLIDYLKLSKDEQAATKKPTAPKKPPYPTIASKRMQAMSEWSQMVAKMMEDAVKNDEATAKIYGDKNLTLTKADEELWELEISGVDIAESRTKTPSAGTIETGFMPNTITNTLRRFKMDAEGRIESLEEDKPIAERVLAKPFPDEAKLASMEKEYEVVKDEVDSLAWSESKRRALQVNRYIAGDKERQLTVKGGIDLVKHGNWRVIEKTINTKGKDSVTTWVVVNKGDGAYKGQPTNNFATKQEAIAWAEKEQLENDPEGKPTPTRSTVNKTERMPPIGPQFSRGTGEGLTTTQTRAILVKHFGEKLIKALESSGLLTIMATPPSWAKPDTDGAYDKDSGKAYLFTDNLSAETVVATLAHELSGHKGFQGLMTPTAYDSLMRQFNRLVKQGNAIALAAKARAEAAESTPGAQQDEYLPYLLTQQATLNATRSQQSAVTKVIEQVYRAVKAWLYRTLSAKGYDGLASKLLQPKDITLLAERMIRGMGNGTNPSNNTKAKGSQFSQLNTPQTQINAVRKKYEGTSQWMKAPNGQPTKLNEMQWLQVRTPNFKAWFGDWENDAKNASKVVDKNGEPMVVYHGTPSDVSAFDEEKYHSETGSSHQDDPDIAGTYASTNPYIAGTFALGESFVPVPFVEKGIPLEQRYQYQSINGDIRSGKRTANNTRNAKGEAISYELVDDNGYMTQPNIVPIFMNIRNPKEFFGSQGYSDSWGYKPSNNEDGVVRYAVSDEMFSRGATAIGNTYIALKPTQIKSAIGNTGEFNQTNPDIRFSQLNTPQTQINAVRRKYEGTSQWMKAPNGQPTKLNEVQWLQVRTPNFKAWFGDWENDPANASKVVDSNGEPLVMYHGSKATDIVIFDTSSLINKGSYFTQDPTLAQLYANDHLGKVENLKNGGVVYPVFLSIKSPLILKREDKGFWAAVRDRFKKDYKEAKLAEDRRINASTFLSALAVEKLRNDSLDGIINIELDETIALDPTQIKSAIGNTGEFNPTNPDIRFSRTEQNPRSSSLDNFIAKAIAEKAWLTTEQINLLNSATTFDELIPLLDKVWNQYFEAKKLKNNNSTKTAVGVDNIKSLIRSEVDSGHITKEHGDLALYFAEKNPALFDSLKSFSFQNDAETLSGNAVGGVYNVVDKVIRISRRTNGSQLTIAHEVLHHAEEFLPENIKSSIIKAWQNDLIRAFKSAENGSNRKTMLHAIIHSIAMGDMSAIEKAIDSMDGVIPANTYHLFNPSEYWAENASRLMNNRSKRQDTWIENARSWINGLIQTLKNALGLQNDAAILKGLRMVLSGSQLKEGGKGIDIDHVYNMKMLNLFSYIGKFNPDGAKKTKTSNEKYSRQSKNPITEGIKSAANDAKNSLPDPIAKSIDNFMAGRILPSSDMANITAKTELSLYHRTIGTQQNTALQNADFKKVYDMAQRYLQHVAVDAYAALKVAPNLLGKLESWSDLKRDVKKIWPANFIKQKADRAAVASIIFDETLNNELLSDADILKALTRDQRQIYKEARDAIQVSLENTAKSEMVRKLLAAEAINWQTVESLINQDLPVGQFAQAIRDLVESRIGGFKNELEAILDADPKIKDALKTSHDKKLTPQTPAQKLTLKEARLTPEQMRTPAQKLAIEEAKATPNKKQQLIPAQKKELKKALTLKAQIETTEEALKSLNDVENRLGTLIEQGYAPLMRFGEYTLTVRDLDGKVKSFFMFESKSEQVRAVNTIVARYGKTVKLETDMISKEEFKQFAGMTPETVALFAKETGMDKDEAYQRYLKHAIPARSAMTRMIKRKGTEGFSDDIQRVVASFVMSNARMSAKNIYAAQIEKSIQDIESGKSVKDQAIVMKENVFNPKENFAQLRNFLFLWNLGGSIFFGLLNMTQPYMQTLPHLSQYVPIKEAFYAIIKGSGIAGSAMKNGTAPKGYEAEYNRAVREGVVDPQNVFMLSGVERGKTGASNSAWGVITHTMGLIAQVTESFNRKAVFIASLQVANKKGAVWLKKKGFNSAYDFAKDTVDQTQGVYDKANRSNWANTSVGAPLMVFKQFSINYVEQMVRMWKKEAASGDEGKKAVFLMLALLASLSGVMGLPFIKDILDVSETTAAFLGNPVNIEREARLALGKDLADPLFNGVLNHFVFNNLGMDIQGRTGMPDLVPWSNALNPTLSAQGRINEFASIAGATGGLIEKGYDATQLIARGNIGTAALTLMPRSITSAFTGGKMAVTDEVMDSKGNKLFDTTWDEGLVKFIDANPKRMADLSRTKSLEWKDFAIQDYMTTSFKQKIIAAMMDKDQAEVNKLMKEVEVWNNARSRYPVYIDLNTLAENANKKDQTFDAREKIRKGMTWVKNERPEM